MTEDTLLPFDLPAVSRKKVTADFAGGSISSDGGLVLLRAAERRLGLAEALAGCIREWRDPALAAHPADLPRRQPLRPAARRGGPAVGVRGGTGSRPGRERPGIAPA